MILYLYSKKYKEITFCNKYDISYVPEDHLLTISKNDAYVEYFYGKT